MMKFSKFFLLSTAAVMALASCSKNPESTGTEFAEQMYHSIAYDPYSSIVDTSSEYYNVNVHNGDGKKGKIVSNMRKPAPGTIARKQYDGSVKGELAGQIYVSNIPADSLDLASKVLKNPVVLTPAILEEGKELYTRYCAPCHGAEGKGNGKVADKYKGVPSYSSGNYKTLSGGHIYHVITHGKGRMWPHGTQVNPDERWKIVHYVHTLQKAQ